MSEDANVETKKRGCGFWIMAGLAVIVGLGIIGSIFGPTEEEMAEIRAKQDAEDAATEAQEIEQAKADARNRIDSAVMMTATELWSAYQANEVAAQRAIGDNEVLISGVIEGVTLDFMDEPVVSLRTGNQFQSVQVDFDDGDADAVAQLSSGETFSALCGKVSEVAGTPMLDDCLIMDGGE